jgi:Ribbon-helix-helix protein, copG family
MERTQISLEPEQAERLRRLAKERGVSMAHLVREAVDRTYGGPLAPPTRAELVARAMSAVGCGHSGLGDVSERHDDYLDEIYAS